MVYGYINIDYHSKQAQKESLNIREPLKPEPTAR